MTHPLVASARNYLRVPWRHRGRSAKGLDCGGLPILAYADLGVDLPDLRAYGREPHHDGLTQVVTAALGDPVARAPVAAVDLREGDVCVFRFAVNPHHVGIITTLPYGGLGLLHAYGEAGEVTEHRLDGWWIERICTVHRRAV